MSKATFVHDGNAIDYTPGSAVAAGDVIAIGSNTIAIAKTPIAASALGAAATRGIFDGAKVTGAVNLGDAIYWDSTGDPVGGVAGSGAFTTTATPAAFRSRRFRRLRQAAPNDRQPDMRRTLLVVKDRLVRHTGLRLQVNGPARVGVAVPQREVAAGHVQADAVALSPAAHSLLPRTGLRKTMHDGRAGVDSQGGMGAIVVAQVMAVIGLLGATVAASEAAGVHVTTKESVDCSSLASIVRDVCAGKGTDQEKAIALFDFARRLMFAWPNRVDPVARHDTLHLLNTYGYSFCSQQALLTVHLWQAAGIKGQVWSVPGHSTMQAEYGGGRHWFDLLIGAYVYRRDGKTIASLEEIAKDRTILTQAVEKGRAPPGFIPERTVLKDDAARFSKHDPKYVKECARHVDDVTFMANLAPVAEKWKWGGPSRSRYQPGISLRAGESVKFLWDFLPDQANCNVLKPKQKPRAYWVAASELPPNHFYGVEAEKRDVNWKYFKPYVKTVNGARTGRYAANGLQVYHPNLVAALTGGGLKGRALSPGSGKPGAPALRVAEAGRAAELACRMRTRHIYTGGTLSVKFRRAAPDDVSRIYLLRKTWDRKLRKMVTKSRKIWDAGDQSAGAGTVTAKLDLKQHIRNLREVTFKLECKTSGDADKAGVADLKIEAIFQHNMFARPYLVAGRNHVSVRVGKPEALKAHKLTVTYAWEEGGKKKTRAKEIGSAPATYTIDVAGKEMPRMVSLEMAVAR